MSILGFWAHFSKGTEAALCLTDLFNSRKPYHSVFLPNFSKNMLVFWVRSCDSGSRRLSFRWTGPITRGPCPLAGFRPQSQIDGGEHNSALTVACAPWLQPGAASELWLASSGCFAMLLLASLQPICHAQLFLPSWYLDCCTCLCNFFFFLASVSS